MIANGVITGALNASPDSIYIIDFYAYSANHSSATRPQGRSYLTSTTIETDATGNAIFTVPYTPFPGVQIITATATAADGFTSEFSPPFSEPSPPLGFALIASGVNLSALTGVPFQGTVASFTSTNPMATATDFTASIDYGDGPGDSTGTVLAAPGGFIVVGSHTFTTADPAKAVTVTIDDVTGSGQATADSVASIVDPLTPTGHAVEFVAGTLYSRVVASFADTDPQAYSGQFTALINWGDWTAETVGVLSAAGAGFDLTGLHTYNVAGTYAFTVTIHDAVTGATVTANSSAVVDPVPTTIQTKNFAVTGGANFSGRWRASPTATLAPTPRSTPPRSTGATTRPRPARSPARIRSRWPGRTPSRHSRTPTS
jgi:hypothetical protein